MKKEQFALKKAIEMIQKHPLVEILNEIKTNITEIPSSEDYYITKEIQKDLYLLINNTNSRKDSKEINSNRKKITISDSNPRVYNLNESPLNDFLQKKPFHHLRLFLQNFDDSLLTENNFNNFISNDIVNKNLSVDENNKLIMNAKNILSLLAAHSEYIEPIEKEIDDYRDTFSSNNFTDTYWTVTTTSKFLNVSRKTIYNWKAEYNFTNINGKIDLNKLLIFFKKHKPNYYTILINELVNIKHSQ